MIATLNKIKSILIKIAGTVALPIIMYVIFLIATKATGDSEFGFFVSSDTTEEIIINTCYASLVAMGLSTQILNGRFDFSAGITIILSSFLAGKIALPMLGSLGGTATLIYVILCVAFSLIISMITATAYKTLGLPMMICSIALTIVYESIPRLVAGDSTSSGLDLTRHAEFSRLNDIPICLILLAVGIIAYFYFKDLSVGGTRARLLANNQLTSVNIGINETKNLFATYIISGIIFGLAAAIYGAKTWIKPAEIGNLSTTSVAFSNIVPVYIGMFIGLLSFGWIGVIAGGLTVQILSRGLVICNQGNAEGIYNIVFGIFMLAFWTLSAELDNIKKLINQLKLKITSKRKSVAK